MKLFKATTTVPKHREPLVDWFDAPDEAAARAAWEIERKMSGVPDTATVVLVECDRTTLKPIERGNDWACEFGTGYAVPAIISNALTDLSWHNDMCPSFGRDDEGKGRLVLWADHPDAQEREVPGGKRFMLVAHPDDTAADSPRLELEFDDAETALAVFLAYETATKAGVWFERATSAMLTADLRGGCSLALVYDIDKPSLVILNDDAVEQTAEATFATLAEALTNAPTYLQESNYAPQAKPTVEETVSLPVAQAQELTRVTSQRDALLVACKDLVGWFNHPALRVKMCDGGRGNLGEQAEYHRVKNQADKAIREAA